LKTHELKRVYGENYPAQITREGVVFRLQQEQRFSRVFSSDDGMIIHEVSRFMDGSASITASELEREWPEWSEAIRYDFASNCGWLGERTDAPEMARFLMKNGDHEMWSAAAQFVAQVLGQEEAFQLLCEKLPRVDVVKGCNVVQAIAQTKHPQARTVLREQLAKLLLVQTLWNDNNFINWSAYALTCCLEHLMELGAKPVDFEVTVRRLAQHACVRNRELCHSRLAKYYDWMGKA